MPAQWFAIEERATAVGLVTLANLVGTALGMVLTPILIETHVHPHRAVDLRRDGGFFGGVVRRLGPREAAHAALPARTGSARPDAGRAETRPARSRIFWLYLLVSFIGMGIFNGITTWVENIIRPRGFTPTDAGTLGALMLVGGVLGAVVIPPFSDRQHKRQRYLLLGIALAIPGLVGLTFATSCLAVVRSRPSRWGSSWSAPARSGCSTPPRSPSPPRKAPPTG